ncbi:hypothetical protein GTP58_20295 [Duganella sp. CY15W]|uniref:hypothetical protein n=1 Tax=Duganella sp. CY15W TaxID=2692172 RepID=UPI001370D31E|nr:hypothetical protein [Duganella sp. CY15W]MYM30677.1 hypothetical protein [Duganella sp. CY15W]
MAAQKIPRETLGLAGEFAVASELCKRGVYAQLTLGNRKRTDLLVDNGTDVLRVEVKSKQGPEWPGVKGISRDDAIIVFVDFAAKSVLQRPDFYILTFKDWKAFVRKKRRDSPPGSVELTKDFSLVWNDGKYVGVGIRPKHIDKHFEAWGKFGLPDSLDAGVLEDLPRND